MRRSRSRRFSVVCLMITLALGACTDTDGNVGDAQPPAVIAVVPTPTFVPVDDAASDPQAPALSSASGDTILLEDDDWQGGYRSSGGSNVYGGRTAVWIYGTATQYNAMTATFEVIGQPFGTAELRVEGMDSEDEAKTPIQIAVNGVEIFNGPNPLPNDDQPLDTGTWSLQTWPFSTDLLQPGANEVRISNLAQGAFSRPPFFMLDYAEVVFEAE